MTPRKSVRESLTDIEKKLDDLITTQKAYNEKVDKHEIEFYGVPASKDSIGLIRTVGGLGDSLDNFKAKYTAIVGGVSMVGSIIITSAVNFILRRHQ